MKTLKLILIIAALIGIRFADAAERPNILWITSEDNGPQLGCYGDTFSTTPNLDALAARGMRYKHAWSVAPVCAPARTAIISGLYPSSTGSEHMRSLVALPEGFRMYPQFLRDAGYYCSNNSKEDYNLEKRGKVWDESSPNAHWKNRKAGQPFFAIFNFTDTHESQIRRRPHVGKHDPSKVPLPAFHPDTPEVRKDWAQYYDQMSVMDAKAGRVLKEIQDAGLAEETIVFYYGDHGPGMPGGKRVANNFGLRVPLIVYFPEKWRHLAPKEYKDGGTSDRLVSFVDLAPTLLSLAETQPPAWMQGHAFAGKLAAEPSQFLYGLRGRMDERYDLVRAVRDQRYVYIRNYMPHKPAGQHVGYMFETPTTRVWKKLHDDGKLPPHQRAFWEPRPPEQLFDLDADPFETRDLAQSPQHQEILGRLRSAHREHTLRVRDVDLLPEAEMLRRSTGKAPYDFGHDPSLYPLEKVLDAAELASAIRPDAIDELKKAAGDSEPGVRYWAVTGLFARGRTAVESAAAEVRKLLADESPSVRVAAAEALAHYGTAAEREGAIDALIAAGDASRNAFFVSVAALGAIDGLSLKDERRLEQIRSIPRRVSTVNARMQEYVGRLIESALSPKGIAN